MVQQHNFLALLVLLFTHSLWGQVSPSATNFRSPMDIPLIVAGNFGEVRTNHFHTGIDFKTQGVEGKKIYAIGEGYISRIAYSHYGYGKALYVTHPNGYTSVYAHLSVFKKPINQYVREHQYQIQEETFNVYLDSNEIKVTKGQVIALSGNSGSSFAPHLHFEIRETLSEHPMNPLLFGYKITDTKKPMINNLKVYPLDEYSLVNGNYVPLVIPVKKNKKGNYYLQQSVSGYGNLGFALHSTDRLNARNICGLYTLDLELNNEHIFGHKMDELDFSTSRYVNHHVDYQRHKKYNNSFHKSFLRGNNLLDIYDYVNDGVVEVEHDSVYRLKYTAKDFKGNSSILQFKVKGDSSKKNFDSKIKFPSIQCLREFKYDQSNYFDTTGFSLLMSPNTLYQDLCFFYKKSIDSSFLSPVHSVTSNVGIQQKYKLILTPTIPVDSSLQSKLLIVLVNDKGRISSRGGSFQNGSVTTRVKELGKFTISIDTLMPYVKLEDKQNVNALKSGSSIRFKIGDNLSGIKSYSVSIDGDWILSRYKRKKNKLIVPLSEKPDLAKGSHKLVIQVTDERGNEIVKYIEITLE